MITLKSVGDEYPLSGLSDEALEKLKKETIAAYYEAEKTLGVIGLEEERRNRANA